MKEKQQPEGCGIMSVVLFFLAILAAILAGSILLSFKTLPKYDKTKAVVTEVKQHQAWARHYFNKYTAIFECTPAFKEGDTVSIVGWKKY